MRVVNRRDGAILNKGVSPDIEVEFDPAQWRKGRDPQLEKGVEVALQELKEHPVPPMTSDRQLVELSRTGIEAIQTMCPSPDENDLAEPGLNRSNEF